MTTKIVKASLSLGLAIGLAPAAFAGGHSAASNSVTVQVPSGSGGTYHVYCQVVQQNLGRHLPAGTKMLIQNLPGAGGAKSASFMANAAPKNGSVIAMVAPGTITVPLWRKVKFDAQKFEWLGAPGARSSAIWIWHTHGVKSIADLKKRKDLKIATSGFASGGSVIPRMVNTLLGTNMRLIYGYKGGGAMNLAIEQGEAMGRWNFRSGFTGVRPTWIPEKKIIPILATGPRDPELKGIPHLRDLLKPGSVEQKAYDVIGMNFEVGQAFYLPPGTPKGIVKTYQKAFDAMLADPALKKMIEQRRIEYSPVTSSQIKKLIKDGFAAATPDVVKIIKAIHTKKKKS
ncbi:MAG: tripartite tricarboxylate transporter substrate-binding protein [Rhodospirillaceae bacterium]